MPNNYNNNNNNKVECSNQSLTQLRLGIGEKYMSISSSFFFVNQFLFHFSFQEEHGRFSTLGKVAWRVHIFRADNTLTIEGRRMWFCPATRTKTKEFFIGGLVSCTRSFVWCYMLINDLEFSSYWSVLFAFLEWGDPLPLALHPTRTSQ